MVLKHSARQLWRNLGGQEGTPVRRVRAAATVLSGMNFVAELIQHALVGSPAGQVFVNIDTYHLVRSKKTVFDSLQQRISVYRLPEVVDVRYFLGFLGSRRQTDLGGR